VFYVERTHKLTFFQKRTIRHKKVKALVIILLTWLLPVILTFAEMVGWSCLDYCECFDAHYSDWENLCHMPGKSNIYVHIAVFLQTLKVLA